MKDTYPDMFVKRALAGGGAHAPVIDTDDVALFCERCAAGMAPAYGEAMRAYARSTRCADSIAHVIERRARHALSSGNPPRVRVRVRGGSAKHPSQSPARSRATSPSAQTAPSLSHPSVPVAPALGAPSAPARGLVRDTAATDATSPSAPLSSDSEGDLLPEDGWSNNDDGCDPFQESLATSSTSSRPGAARCAAVATLQGPPESSPQKGRRRSRPPGDGESHRASDGQGTAAERPAKRRRTASDGRSAALEETSTSTTAIERAHDAALVARVMRQCARGNAADGTRSLCVWRWGADRRWRLVAEVRCASADVGAPWEVVREAPGGHEANVSTTSTPAWIDARDLETLIHRALESPCDLVALGDSRQMPSLDAFYADDGGRHEDVAPPGATEAPVAAAAATERDTVASALDAWLATACRRWVRAPHDRSEGLDLFRRAVAFGVHAAGTPCGPHWACLVEDVQNALA
ncbi:atrophin-1 incomplete domain containing protein [Pandoravirus japonicus]|uniref:Atrophin-1 incomplete domain containing protein n=1 Tax=Pandoravirus japonicus TaxID=2823154 RepID=A0A811BMZ1_9VIRU|nr:atrophin-1 incomplete domain containing protein [Pandoravirus japonicus]